MESERQPTTPIEYYGWIYGNVEDEWTLRELGVTGKPSAVMER